MDSPEVDFDIELQQATVALTRARARKAAAEDAARTAAQIALAKQLAQEQERLAIAKRENEEAQQRAIAKRQAAADAQRQADAQRAAETRRLEQELEQRNESARQEAARLERTRKVQEQARQSELDALAIETSLLQSQSAKEEQKPSTLETTPLSFLFGHATPSSAPSEGLSAEETARLQREVDAAVIATEPVRKAKPTQDTATSGELESILRPALGGFVNPSRCDSLASVWMPSVLLATAKLVVEQMKDHPYGHDQALGLLQALLEEAENAQQTT